MNIAQELERARAAAQRKDGRRARTILRKVLEQEPHNVDAWLLFAEVAQKPAHAVQCLEHVLQIDPGNEGARQKLNRLYAPRHAPAQTRQNFAQDTPPVGEEPADRSSLYSGGVREQLLGSYDPYEPVFEQEVSPGEADVPTASVSNPISTETGSVQAVGTSRGQRLPGKAVGQRLRSISARPKREPLRMVLRYVEVAFVSMIFGLFLCALAGVVFLFLGGDTILQSLRVPVPTLAHEALTDVVYQNIRAISAENLAACMTTIHPQSPIYTTTQELLETSFATYDLSYEIAQVEVVEEDENEVQVAFVLTIRKIRGPDFRDNRVTGIMFLRQDHGVWKIYDQRIDRIEYLDEP